MKSRVKIALWIAVRLMCSACLTIKEKKKGSAKVFAWTGPLGDALFINVFPDEAPLEATPGFYRMVLVTAPTRELQSFAREHAGDEKAFGERIELVRDGGR